MPVSFSEKLLIQSFTYSTSIYSEPTRAGIFLGPGNTAGNLHSNRKRQIMTTKFVIYLVVLKARWSGMVSLKWWHLGGGLKEVRGDLCTWPGHQRAAALSPEGGTLGVLKEWQRLYHKSGESTGRSQGVAGVRAGRAWSGLVRTLDFGPGWVEWMAFPKDAIVISQVLFATWYRRAPSEDRVYLLTCLNVGRPSDCFGQ